MITYYGMCATMISPIKCVAYAPVIKYSRYEMSVNIHTLNGSSLNAFNRANFPLKKKSVLSDISKLTLQDSRLVSRPCTKHVAVQSSSVL